MDTPFNLEYFKYKNLVILKYNYENLYNKNVNCNKKQKFK